jgi:hypothetical protein
MEELRVENEALREEVGGVRVELIEVVALLKSTSTSIQQSQ